MIYTTTRNATKDGIDAVGTETTTLIGIGTLILDRHGITAQIQMSVLGHLGITAQIGIRIFDRLGKMRIGTTMVALEIMEHPVGTHMIRDSKTNTDR